MGANMSGAGTHVIEIEGVERLHGADHEVIPDRIEAGSMMAAAAITGGDVTITNVPIDQLDAVTTKLREAGVVVEAERQGIRVARGDNSSRSSCVRCRIRDFRPTCRRR